MIKQKGLKRWNKFLQAVKRAHEVQDLSKSAASAEEYLSQGHPLLDIEVFASLLRKWMRHVLTDQEKRALSTACEDGKSWVDLDVIYKTLKAKRIQELISKVSLGDNEEDDAKDAAGYTGDIHRHLKERYIKHKQITMDQFIAMVRQENKLRELFQIIKTIDKDHNGFITQTEMDDILKLLYRT
mmetsp:Transcript_33653/g.51934  ORF Transcript_33653/g.51934 Transcript_33653/m.51934 type:complete len:184 (-) Transcript_33653:1607-2158(-)|eukprot:CAMPEP_0170508636 /NCGR_PEP_ID=MMETSP0208-20121228/62959_1 /TAXON_ID=197538 /ORGANISM="Strombidium inclinatum, Strain S3" /LENGTH=183 /DNA_ID=CAMNT_0010791651 /DNA_START=1942 /DNA_END=2493 /DNA_ORIENTATION=-